MEGYRRPADPPGQGPRAVAIKPLRRRFNPWLRLGLMWLAVVAMLLGAYLLTDGMQNPLPIGFLLAVLAAFTLSIAGLLVFYRRRAMKLAIENNEGIALLNSGRLDEAITLYGSLYSRAGNMHSLRALFVTNLGIAYLRRGEADRALEHFDIARKSGWVARQKLLPNQTVLLMSTATAQFARGDIAAAKETLAEAQRGCPPARRGMLLAIETLVATREGEFAQAAEHAGMRWSEAEALLPATSMRLLRVLRAFALVNAGLGETATREASDLLIGARPSRLGEFDYIAQNWPAFRAFLVEHGFAV